MSDAKKPEDKKPPGTPETPAEPTTPAAPVAPAGAKLKPEPFSQSQIADQVLTMRTQHNQLDVSHKQLAQQLTRIQTALKDNDNLRAKIATQATESHANFKEEIKRKSDFFPEIRFAMLQKAVEAIAPKK